MARLRRISAKGAAVTGVWLGASYILRRPVPVGEPYPHVCSLAFVSLRTGKRVWLGRRDCAACVQQEHEERQQLPVDQLPPVDPDITALEARRLGEHD